VPIKSEFPRPSLRLADGTSPLPRVDRRPRAAAPDLGGCRTGIGPGRPSAPGFAGFLAV